MTSEEKRAYGAAYRAAHKEEKAAYQAAHYAAHKEEARACHAAYHLENRDAILEKQRQDGAEFTEWLQNLRTVNGCADCGIHEGLLLHHHVDPSTKRYNVSRMYGCSHDILEDELEQCVVLCPSCHAKHHAALRAA